MCSSGVLPLGHFFWSLTFTVVDEDIYGCSIWVVYLKSLIHSILMCRSDHVAKSLLHKDFKFNTKNTCSHDRDFIYAQKIQCSHGYACVLHLSRVAKHCNHTLGTYEIDL